MVPINRRITDCLDTVLSVSLRVCARTSTSCRWDLVRPPSSVGGEAGQVSVLSRSSVGNFALAVVTGADVGRRAESLWAGSVDSGLFVICCMPGCIASKSCAGGDVQSMSVWLCGVVVVWAFC